MKKIIGIYALICPDTMEVRYIGQSIDIKTRYLGHVHTRPKKDKPSSKIRHWCSDLKASGKKPILLILDICTKSKLDRLEIKHIKRSLESGDNLLNMHKGGKINFKHVKASYVWSLDGYDDPYTVFIRSVFCLRNIKLIRDNLKTLSDSYKAAKTEFEKLNHQIFFADWVLKNAKPEVTKTMERYLIEVAPKINAKFQGRMTLVYNDGIEETP